MRLALPVANIINDQIHNELDASYVYLGLAAYFDSEELPGFASWFRVHSREEHDHAMRLYDFLTSCDIKVELKPLNAPSTQYDSPAAAIKAALEHEETVTEQIKKMFGVAHNAEEYTAHPLLHWFLAEQVEEEELFRTTLNRVEAAQNRFDLLMLDAQMAKRNGEGEGGHGH